MKKIPVLSIFNARPVRITTIRWKIRLRRASEFILGSIVWLTVFASLLTMVVLISFTAVHLNAVSGTEAPKVFKSITDAVFKLWRVSPKTPQEFATAVNLGLNGLLVAVSLIFAVQPFVTFYMYRRKLHQQQSIRPFPVYEDGVDDTKVLEKAYRDAESITVFSGDFDWLRTSPKLAENLRRKLSRVRFISYRSASEVERALGPELFEEFKGSFVFDCPVRIKCSLVEYPGHSVFLYKALMAKGDQLEKVVCAVRGLGTGRYLLDALTILCKQNAAQQARTPGEAHAG